MNGLLLIDKPKGWTSFDVVAKVRSVLRQPQILVDSGGRNDATKVSAPASPTNPKRKIKVGHAGTLDPLATGLMLILVGDYCKRAQEFSKLDKSYAVTALLGQTSTTGDAEGQKQPVSDRQPSLAEVKTALQRFMGPIQQTPPAYSAVKINGQRAYKLARAGQAVKIEPRTVTIYDITEVDYQYPRLSFTVSVSSGTYIRSLVEDVGQVLGVGAYTTELRRLSIGQFGIAQALALANCSGQELQANLHKVK